MSEKNGEKPITDFVTGEPMVQEIIAAGYKGILDTNRDAIKKTLENPHPYVPD